MAPLDKLVFAPEDDGKTFAAKFSDDRHKRQDGGVFFLKARTGIDIECASGPCEAKITFHREIGKLWETLRRIGLFDRTAIVMAGGRGP
jgi:hypothetical protein